jgi:hypothetical protein
VDDDRHAVAQQLCFGAQRNGKYHNKYDGKCNSKCNSKCNGPRGGERNGERNGERSVKCYGAQRSGDAVA